MAIGSKPPHQWTTGRITLVIFLVLFSLIFLLVALDRGFNESDGLLLLRLLALIGTLAAFASAMWKGLGKYMAKCPTCQKGSEQYIGKKNKAFLTVACPYCKHTWHR